MTSLGHLDRVDLVYSNEVVIDSSIVDLPPLENLLIQI